MNILQTNICDVAMQKKLVFILKAFPRISETFILQEIRQLEATGHAPIIFSRAYPEDEPFIQTAALGLQSEVHYIPYALPKGQNSVRQLQKRLEGKYDLQLMRKTYHDAKVKGQKDPENRSRHCVYAAIWILAQLNPMNSKEYHIHAQFLDYPAEIAYYIHLFSGIEYSISCHAKDIYTSPKEDHIRFLASAVALKTCTEFNAAYLKEETKMPEKIHKIYHGIDSVFFSRETVKKKIRLVSVARLVEKKGYFVMLKALDMLDKRYPNFQMTIIGHGKLDAEIREQIRFLHLEGKVIIIPFATREVVRDYLLNSDIFVNASIITKSGDRDGIPNSIAEAMSMELPVVASDISGIGEIVKHLDTGYIAQSRDAASLYNGIVYFIENPSERELVGKRARQFILEHFTKEKAFVACEEFFRSLLDKD